MNISEFSRDCVAILAPVLPALVNAGEAAATEAMKAVGKDAWEKAKKIWAGLSQKIAKNAAATGAVQDLASEPDDPDAQASLRLQLKKLFQSDPELLREFAEALGHAVSQTVTATRGSEVSDVSQEASSSESIAQTVDASDDSIVKGIKQKGNT